MVLQDSHAIGERLYRIRKRYGLTQLEVATKAGVSEKTYAQFERGTLNVRLETILQICTALHITPDEIIAANPSHATTREAEILARLHACNPRDQETALRLLETYLQSLD